ncbi:hypothetical protein [Selenomonas sp. AB3002]|uniref:hypothetical protein n=1 Tax=Selenomonas sp. AB3002 TaxID=1392502 RepID=UPI000498483D
MDMKEQTRNSVLTAMVCIALSSGTAWAAVPDEPVPAVQQRALTGSAAAQAAELRSMPLYWSALKPKEEQVKKAQPIIITADDIDAKRKEEKRAAAAQAAKGAQKKPADESKVQPQVNKPVATPKPEAASQAKPDNKGAVSQPVQAQKPVASEPLPVQPAKPAGNVPASAQPDQPVRPKEQQPTAPPVQTAPPVERTQPAAPAVKPQPATPAATPQPKVQPVPQSEYRPQPEKAAPPVPPQEPAPPPRQMVKIHPEGLYASRRQKPLAEPVPQGQEPASREERQERAQVQPTQPEGAAQQPLPQQIQVERPPEYEGISDEVVRHIMAGEYAMRYQLSRDPSEPGVYHAAQILNQNTGLSHLQKIEYLMGFGRAINRSHLSEYQKKALIDAVLQAFGEK